MSSWGAATYGDPCRECGFDWSIAQGSAAAGIVAETPTRYAELLAGTDGRQQHPDLSWSAGSYVCHVGDNLRIWAERLAAMARGASGSVAPYDQDLLAQARQYQAVPVEGALWPLRRAVSDWSEAVALAAQHNVVLHHAEQGQLTVLDVARSNAHDAHHHRRDIERSIG